MASKKECDKNGKLGKVETERKGKKEMYRRGERG